MSLIEFIVLGFIISAIPGAVFFETLRRSVMHPLSAVRFQVGNFVGMLTIIVTAHIGLAAFFLHDTLSAIFYAISGLVLLYIGVQAAMVRQASFDANTTAKSFTKPGSLISGLTLALANPISILFWVSLIGAFIAERHSTAQTIISSLAVVGGALIFFVLLILLSSWLRQYLRPLHLVWLSRIFGVAIILFGLNTLYAAL